LYDTSIYELTQADATYQGSTVQIVGEVVGDVIRAEEDEGKRWITLEAIEEEYESSISVLVDESAVNLIDTFGGYNRKGTTLQVRGTFYLACLSHEGILDIHAESVTLVARGSTTTDEFDLKMFVPAIIFCAIGVLVMLLYRYLRERER
ncbi:MAG: hydrolase, partial [Eggerthellaceae bacterium]|nr:hydrolase [Eggerthellaceae bacterium]